MRGYICLKAVREHEGAFKIYPKDGELQLTCYSYFGRGWGGNIEYIPAEMIKNGSEIIHLATGLLVGYPPCPKVKQFREFIASNYNMFIAIGTHPLPKNMLLNEKLGYWKRLGFDKLAHELSSDSKDMQDNYN